MKCCVSTDVGTWTNWLTFEPDPDYSPDAGTGLLSPLSYQRCYAEFYVGKIRRITYWPLQRGVVLKWFHSLRQWAVETPESVGGTCAPPSALPVTGRPARSAAMSDCRYCFYSVVQNGFFAPQGRHVASINVKFGTGERRSASPCQIWRLSGQKCGNTAPKTVKIFEFWPEICTSGATRLQCFNEIFSVCTRL